MFGCGCDCFGILFMGKYHDAVNVNYANAHNEFIQYLVTTGIFGFLAYTAIWLSVIYMFVKKKKHTTKDMALFSGIIGYLGQALINNPQAANYAVLFLLLGLYNSEYYDIL